MVSKRTANILYVVLPFIATVRMLLLVFVGCCLVLISTNTIYVYLFLASAFLVLSSFLLEHLFKTKIMDTIYYSYARRLRPQYSSMIDSTIVMSWFTPNTYTVVLVNVGHDTIVCSYRHYSFYYLQSPHEDTFHTTSLYEAFRWMDSLKYRYGIEQFASTQV